LCERVLARKVLWIQEQAEFHGQFVNFDPVWLYPSRGASCTRPSSSAGETDHIVG
jgi:hypothetical protein